jgi:hypothetical protein
LASITGQVVVAADRGVWHSLSQRCSWGPIRHSWERINAQQTIGSRDSEPVAESDLAEIVSIMIEDVVAQASADVATVTCPQVSAIVEIAEILAAPSP